MCHHVGMYFTFHMFNTNSRRPGSCVIQQQHNSTTTKTTHIRNTRKVFSVIGKLTASKYSDGVNGCAISPIGAIGFTPKANDRMNPGHDHVKMSKS